MRSLIIRITFLLGLMTATCAIRAQLPVKYLKFETLTINDGLSQGMINCILQDHYGFMWFATKDGLNRYDGYRFITYKHNPSDSNSLSDNFVQNLFEDSEGRFWISTASKGIELFNREKEIFIHLRHKKDDPASIPDDHVNYVHQDNQGVIWVSTIKGLSRMVVVQNKSDKKENYIFQNLDFNKYVLFTQKKGNSYFAGNQKLYIQEKQKKRSLFSDTLDLKKISCYQNSDPEVRQIQLFVEDTLSQTLYFIFSDRITKSELQTGKVELLWKSKPHRGIFGNQPFLDETGTIWMCDFDWLLQFDTKSRQMQHVIAYDHNQDNMMDNVNYVYKDKSGIIWLGTKGFGILKYNPRSEKFHHTDNESILSMSAGTHEKILVCKNGGLIHLFDKPGEKYTHIIPDSSVILSKIYSNNGILEAGIQENDSIFWICKDRIIRYNFIKKTFTDYRTENLYNFPLFKDRMGQIWCGSEKSFCQYDQLKNLFKEYEFPITGSDIPYKFVESIYQDQKGYFWLGTTEGLFRFDPVNHSWLQFKNSPNDTSSLGSDILFSICPDPDEPENYLWIGTNGGGLNRFEIKTGKVIRFTEKDGLPNDVIYGILSDRNKNLWMSTNKGLSRFNIINKKFRNYELRDGLQSNEYNRNAYCKLQDGTLCFGGVNGFNYFDPKDLSDNTAIPKVQITDFKISNQSIDFKKKDSPLIKPAYLSNEITLHYRDNMISFEFASMDFTAPLKNQYQYRLEGFDDHWIPSGTNHSATYTNLNPGIYVFKIRGSNNDEIWNQAGAAVKLIILPPWYMTWWFRISLVVFAFALVYGWYRYRLEQNKKLQAVRNRIARDLHDEIGSTLLSISLYSEVAGKVVDDKVPEAKSMLIHISESTTNMMEAMSDIVWTINTNNDRFDNLVNRMRAFAVEVLEAKHCQLHFKTTEQIHALQLGMEFRKNLYLIFKEAINNITKHSQCKNVWIDFHLQNKHLLLKIKDDGKGFDATIRSHENGSHITGNGLNNMYKRASELKGEMKISSEPGKGTSMELLLKL